MLYEKTRYISPYSYLINKKIQEYDISKANISILREYGYIDDKKYEYLYSLPKKNREIRIGLEIRKNPEVNNILNNGFLNARKVFFESNDINDMNVLYIDKDSVTVIDQFITNQRISKYINFVAKDKYTSFYRLGSIDFLYFNDNKTESYRFKNINHDMLIENHRKYMIDFLLSIAYMAQNNSIINVIDTVRNFYGQYVSRRLNIGYYREFNMYSRFRMNSYNNYDNWSVDESSYTIDMNDLDISYNASIIQDLYKYFMNEYFTT